MDTSCTRETSDKFIHWIREILKCIEDENYKLELNQSNVVPLLAKIESKLNELSDIRNYYAIKDKLIPAAKRTKQDLETFEKEHEILRREA